MATITRCEVLDHGPGISAELRGRVFEPFFTTKDVGEGTGLGLSISHGIASAHGGMLELRDSAAGARFRLSLPIHEQTQRPPREDPEGRRAVIRALVVDDEMPIRQLLVRLLERRGFDVVEASTSEAAIELGRSAALNLVICDVSMPGTERFRAVSPAVGRATVTGWRLSVHQRRQLRLGPDRRRSRARPDASQAVHGGGPRRRDRARGGRPAPAGGCGEALTREQTGSWRGRGRRTRNERQKRRHGDTEAMVVRAVTPADAGPAIGRAGQSKDDPRAHAASEDLGSMCAAGRPSIARRLAAASARPSTGSFQPGPN